MLPISHVTVWRGDTKKRKRKRAESTDELRWEGLDFLCACEGYATFWRQAEQGIAMILLC